MQLIPTAQAARQFVLIYHGEQKYGTHPYVFHLDQVAALLAPYGEIAQILGYLHDVKEDAGGRRAMVADELLKQFGPFIANCVELLSDAPGLGRKERKELAHQKLASVTGDESIVLIVKLCDRIANIEYCLQNEDAKLLKMYTDEFAAFRAAAYRPGLCDTLWLHVENLLSLGQSPEMSP